MKKKSSIIVLLLIVVASVFFYMHVTILVIHPIGALPEGKTLIISRLNKTQFIDSPDAMCERLQGGVSLLCRGMILGKVLETTTVYARLPYFDWLYLLSTGGNTYER